MFELYGFFTRHVHLPSIVLGRIGKNIPKSISDVWTFPGFDLQQWVFSFFCFSLWIFLQRLPLMDAAALARSASTSYLLALLAAIVAELQGRLQDESSDEWQLPDGSSGARFAGGFSSQSGGSQQAPAPAGLNAQPPHALPPQCSHTCEFCGNPCSRPTNRRTHRHHRCILHRHL